MAASLAAVDMAASGEMVTILANTSEMQNLGGYIFPRTPTDGKLMLLRFSVAEDAHKGMNHHLAAVIRLVILPAYAMTVSVMLERTAVNDLFTAKVLMVVHLK